MANVSFRWHETAYWILMVLCLITAGICVTGAVMNSSFAAAVEDREAYVTAARYWMYGAIGFVLIASGFGVNAILVRRRRRNFRIKSSMVRLYVGALTFALASALLYLAHLLMNPAPIAAVGAAVGGLLAFWLRQSWRWLAAGAVFGALLGAAIHTYSHVAEGRVESSFQLFNHVAGDAAVGLLVGVAVVGVALAVNSIVTGR